MSALSVETFVPLAVMGAALAGSGHCVSMCGGLVASIARTRGDLALYQLGRLAGYATLGALAGGLGRGVLDPALTGPLSWVAAAMLAFALVRLGVASWKGQGLHVFALPRGLFAKLHSRVGGSAFPAGVLTALLPCGWLHGFVLAAAATRGFASGALLLSFFWLGTLPALVAAPALMRSVLSPAIRRAPRFSAVILVCAGVATVGMKFMPHPHRATAADSAQEEQSHVCH